MLEQAAQRHSGISLVGNIKSWLARALDNPLSTEGWNICSSEILSSLDFSTTLWSWVKVIDWLSFDLEVRLYIRKIYESATHCHPTNTNFKLPYWSIHFPTDFNICSCRLFCLLSITSSFWRKKPVCYWALERLAIKIILIQQLCPDFTLGSRKQAQIPREETHFWLTKMVWNVIKHIIIL